MSADKNHEKYLEEIETAVAETTKALMENEDYNLREAYRKIAEQDVEIKRLKEYQSSDRKTIRNLRAQLAEATEENEKLKEENKNWCGIMMTATEKIQRKKDNLEKDYYKLEEEVEGYESICKEYLDGSEETTNPESLRAYVDDKVDEIYALECTVDDKDEEIETLKKQYAEIKEREEYEWEFLERGGEVGDYRQFLKEYYPEYLKKIDYLAGNSDSDED